MGNTNEYPQTIKLPQNCKIYSELKLTSARDLEEMGELLTKRAHVLSACPFICTLASHQVIEDSYDFMSSSCRQSDNLVIFYQTFDFKLSQIPLSQYQFADRNIVECMLCVCEGLQFLTAHQIPYGDICPDNVCYKSKGDIWMLIDKAFLKNGITAYEKFLEGEPGFISPKQMDRIRHGFIRESPEITEADDVFGLGLVALQMGSGMESDLIYRESHCRISQNLLRKHLKACEGRISWRLMGLIERMLNFDEDERIGLRQTVQLLRSQQYGRVNGQPQVRSYSLNQRMQPSQQKIPIMDRNPHLHRSGFNQQHSVHRHYQDRRTPPLNQMHRDFQNPQSNKHSPVISQYNPNSNKHSPVISQYNVPNLYPHSVVPVAHNHFYPNHPSQYYTYNPRVDRR